MSNSKAVAVVKPEVVTPAAPAAEATSSGYKPELTQRVYVPSLGDITRGGKPRVTLGQTRDGRRVLQFASAKRGQSGYASPKLFAVSDSERWGALASQLAQALAEAGANQGLLVEIEAFEVPLPGPQPGSLWRVTALRLVPPAERPEAEDPWGVLRGVQEGAQAAAAAAKAGRTRPASDWQAPPVGAEDEGALPF